jgi:hypothetical protein
MKPVDYPLTHEFTACALIPIVNLGECPNCHGKDSGCTLCKGTNEVVEAYDRFLKSRMLLGGREVFIRLAKHRAAEVEGLAPLIQDSFPDLSADEREFIVSGMTPPMWDRFIAQCESDE